MDETMRGAAQTALLMAENDRLRELLDMERSLYAETRRKLEKADHDRQRYAKRIRFMDGRHTALCAAYKDMKKERDILETALNACERSLRDAKAQERR